MTDADFENLSFYKIVQGLLPQCFTKYLKSNCAPNYQIRAADENNLKEFSYRIKSFEYFPSCISEWDSLRNSIREAKSVKIVIFNAQPNRCKIRLRLKFSHLKLRSHIILHYSWSADLLKSLSQLNMSTFTFHKQYIIIFSQYFFNRFKMWGLNEHKFRHKLKDCVSLTCNYGADRNN